jgi:hypothetical protein
MTYLEKRIAGVNGELFDLLVVVRVGVVGIAVGPQPQLRVRVEAVALTQI